MLDRYLTPRVARRQALARSQGRGVAVDPEAVRSTALRRPCPARHQEPILPTSVPTVAFSDERLSNGLRLIVAEDHLAPVVAVNVWYDVGSKHEVPGKTGFAHLFE